MSSFDTDYLDTFEELSSEIFDCGISSEYIEILALREGYGYNNLEVVQHLDDNPELRNRIGIQEAPSNSMISRVRTKLKERQQPYLRTIKEVSERAVLILYVTKATIPDQAFDEHDLLNRKPLDETQQSDQLVMAELVQTVDNILSEILDPLSFERCNPEIKIRQFVGLLAHLGLYEIEPSGGARSANYLCDAKVPDGSTLLTYVRQMYTNGPQPTTLIKQFDNVFKQFYSIANEKGFCDESKRIVVDSTKMSTTANKRDEGPLIGGAKDSQNPTKHGENSWVFQVVSISNAESPFILNIRPVYKKSKYPPRLDEQLTEVEKLPIDVELLIADSEYYQSPIVKKARDHLCDDWLIRADKRGVIKTMHSKGQKGKTFKKQNIDFGEFEHNNGPNGFVYPNSDQDEKEQKTLHPHNDKNLDDPNAVFGSYHQSDHIGYITDRELNEESMRELHVLYRRRATIEPIIGQLRDTYLAPCRSQSPAVRFFLTATAGLFYNIFTLVNRMMSTQNGIPLDVSGKETLLAIRESCLD